MSRKLVTERSRLTARYSNTVDPEAAASVALQVKEQGFAILRPNPRGSTGYGKNFRYANFQDWGYGDFRDLMSGVDHVIDMGVGDPDRLLLMGWSYGGYLSLMSFFKHPEIYSAAVAVAPVTDWKLYDTHYTERYMETPQNNPQGYKNSNVLQHIQKAESHLLVIHGMADDNVLFSHSTQLFSKLQEKAQPFSMMIYPGKKHGIAGKNARIHVFSTITEFFNEKLKQK